METFPPTRIPVSLLTGFLGSGKTTLLGRLIHHRGMAETAVIINEFGEIGLDHHLIESVDGEAVLMASGCICCTMRDDLARTLRELAARRAAGAVPPFRRVVIETTGLADPAPILHSLMQDARVRDAYELDGVITTIDAVNGGRQLDQQPVSLKQAAVADRVVVTKSDLAEAEATARLIRRLRALNPGAEVVIGRLGDADPETLFGVGALPARLGDQRPQAAAGQGQHGHVCGPACGHDHDHGHDHDAHAHHLGGIQSHAFRFDEPLDWAVVSDWLGGLAFFHGDALLRMKGLLNVKDEPAPVAVHAVQHLFHEPTQLDAWPDADRSSRLVFITQGLDRETIAAAYAAACAQEQAT